MPGLTIDINCDIGESYGNFKIGRDKEVFPYLTSCNVACGFHGGDPLHMEETVKWALEYGVQIGAHPSYPDLSGFGRRKMHIAPEELRAIVKYQMAALKGITESLGGKVKYVKPHGALYNSASNDVAEAEAIMNAVQEIDSQLALMGLAGSDIEKIAAQRGFPFVPEAFADRVYNATGNLVSRTSPGSVIIDPKQASEQVLSLVLNKEVKSTTGDLVHIEAKSICIHGDNPNAVEILKSIDRVLAENQIEKRSFSK